MLEELQSLSEIKKKQLLVIATIIIMAIIVGVWAVYFNSVVMGTSQPPATQTTSAAVAPTAMTPTPIAISATPPAPTPAASGPSLWQRVEGGFKSIVGIFKKPSQYNIQPK